MTKQPNPQSGPESVTEDQVQDFWTRFPMIYSSKAASPEQMFADMERVMREQFWYAQGPDAPLFDNYLHYRSLAGKKVLEIGPGTGWLTNEFIRSGADVHAIDLSKSHVELCRHRFRGARIELQVASAEAIPYPDNSFDLVAAWGVLHHAADDAQCYREVHRVLKPGGRTFLGLYRRHGPKYLYHNLFRKGILGGGLLRHQFNVDAFIRSVTDKYGDDSPGAPISRHYTGPQLRALLSMFSHVNLDIAGAHDEFSEIPLSHLPVSDWLLDAARREALLKRHGGYWVVDAVK